MMIFGADWMGKEKCWCHFIYLLFFIANQNRGTYHTIARRVGRSRELIR
jgi:hypothetical protein